MLFNFYFFRSDEYLVCFVRRSCRESCGSSSKISVILFKLNKTEVIYQLELKAGMLNFIQICSMPLRLLNEDTPKTALAKLIGTSLRKVATFSHYTINKAKNSHYLGYIFAPYPFDSVRKASYVPQCIASNSKNGLLSIFLAI
jgi:hypothetical protein